MSVCLPPITIIKGSVPQTPGDNTDGEGGVASLGSGHPTPFGEPTYN